MVDLIGVCLSFILSHQWTCWCVWKYFNPPGHWQSGPCARARVTSMNFLPQYLSKAFKDIIWMLSYSAHECYRMVKEFPWKIIKCGRYEVMCVRARARARVLQTWYPHSSHIYWYFVPNLIDSEPKLPEETDSVTQKDHKWIVCEILRL